MLFSSMTFIYFFLPLVFLLYFIAPRPWKNGLLLLSSIFFYFAGEPRYTILLIVSSLAGYFLGLLIEKFRGTKIAKGALIAALAINLLILGFFKYFDFFVTGINTMLGTDMSLWRLALPIGISFYTFQTMSYLIDLYKGKIKVQRNIISFSSYVTLFPQLVAGPIVRYETIARELEKRRHTFDDFASGVKRFTIGLGKKVLIANVLGELNVLAMETGEPSMLFYWLGAIAFTLQIYFDFSGYSDMAIGLGRCFGFHFLENFNYPYISRSVTEFWRRWHISLGSWFRDYVYIPLGGNRVGRLKWVRNIFIVWFLTGFWHGASWNFIVWGLYFGVLLLLEKVFIAKLLEKIPRVFSHIYVMFLIVISFVIFNIDGISGATQYLKGMFWGLPAANSISLYYLKSYAVIISLAAFCATPVLKNMFTKAGAKPLFAKAFTVLEPVFYVAVLLLVTGYLLDSSFNPFLYFRF